MYCTKCGNYCADDSAVCSACGADFCEHKQTSYSGKYSLDDLAINEEEMERDRHAEEFRNLLNKGIIGIVIGFFIGSAITGLTNENDAILPWILYPTIAGLICAGVPFGWSLISRGTGGLNVYGNIIVMLFFYGFKFAISLMIGVFVFPFLLLEHYRLSKEPGSKARKVCTIIMVSLIALPVLFVIVISALESFGITFSDSAEELSAPVTTTAAVATAPAQTTPVMSVTASSFSEDGGFIEELCETAKAFTQGNEVDTAHAYGWTVTESSQILYILFFNPTETYSNTIFRPDLTNAIIIISGYYVTDAGSISMDAWEMDVQVFPNVSYADGALVCESDNIYQDGVRAENVNEALEYVYSEYGESNMTVLYDAQS